MKRTYSASYWLWKIGAFLPLIILTGIVFLFSANIPWFDDFLFPDFLQKWLSVESVSEEAKLILEPINEHRMVFAKLATLLIYWWTNTLNFTYLHLIGFGFTVGIFSIFFKIFRENNLTTKEFVPISWFLFQWQYQMVFLWAVCSLQHQPVVFFLCLSMYMLVNERLSWAVLFSLCTNFAMGNGMFVWISGAVVLIYQRAFIKLFVWLFLGAMGIMAYFYGLSSMGNEQSLVYLQKHPEETFLGFFAFLGGLFDFFPEKLIDFRLRLPVLFGIILTLLTSTWLFTIGKNWMLNFKQKNNPTTPHVSHNNTLVPFVLGILTFLLCNAAVIALLRPRFGLMVMIVSNYKLYPALFMMVVYSGFIAIASLKWQSIILKLGLITSIGIWLISLLHYGPMMIEWRKNLHTNAFNQQHNGFGLGHQPNSLVANYVNALMQKLEEKKIYTYPSEYSVYFKQITTADSTIKTTLDVSLLPQTQANSWLITAPYSPTWGIDDGVYAFLRSSKKLYVFKMQQKLYDGRNVLKRNDKFVSLQLSLTPILPAQYHLGFMVIEGKKTSIGFYKRINIKKNVR